MERVKYLSERLHELFLDGRWIANTNYHEVLIEVNAEAATKRIGSLHTISELVYHIHYYLEGLCRVFRGEPLTIKDSLSFNLPPIYTEDDWLALKKALLTSSSQFIFEVTNMDNKMLDECFVNANYGTWLRNIEGVIEHSYYHLGQIVLIKKLISV